MQRSTPEQSYPGADAPAIPADLIRLAEAARLVPGRGGKAIHLATIFRWVQQGKLRAWKVGGRLLVSTGEVKGLFRPVTPKSGRVPPAAREASRQQLEAETSRILREHGLE